MLMLLKNWNNLQKFYNKNTIRLKLVSMASLSHKIMEWNILKEHFHCYQEYICRKMTWKFNWIAWILKCISILNK